jgi:hypothetical protein
MRTGGAVTVEVCWSGELRRFGTLREALWSIRPLTSDEETAMTTYRPAWAGLLEE